MEKSHLEKIEYILARSLFQKSSYDETDIKKNEDEFLHYKNNLLNLSDTEVNTLFLEAQEDSEFYYHDKWSFADFSFWSRAACWKIDEAVALSFCRDPIVVNAKKLQYSAIYSDSAEIPEEYRGGLYQRYKSIMPKIAPFYVQYKDRYRLAQRAVKAEILSDPVKPAQFIEWLKHIRLPVPERLEAALRENGVHIRDWRAAFERLQRDSEAERTAAADEIAKLKAELENTLQQPKTRQSEHPKAIKSMQKILLAVAVKNYHFRPGKRNSAISNIVTSIVNLGMNLDEDTVRNVLQKAVEDLKQSEGIDFEFYD